METDQQANILLVDDRPENLLALESILGDLGCALIKADSGREALRCCLQQDFVVILLDVQMPGMDGFETAELIRERDRMRHTPIIFLTAIGKSEENIMQGYSVGAVDYLLKPFVPEVLRWKVAVFVDLFRMREQVRQQAEQLASVNSTLQREIAERKRAEEEMRALTFVDDLTGLHNRRGFLAFAEQALNLSRRLKRRPLLLYIDLDGLKRINDAFGHHEGDLALVEMATALRETFRDSDIIARLGGDEFAVLAIEGDEASAEVIATRMRESLAHHNAGENRRYSLSLSFGAARYDPRTNQSVGELLADADTLMYGEKRARGVSRPVGWAPSGRAAPADRATTESRDCAGGSGPGVKAGRDREDVG